MRHSLAGALRRARLAKQASCGGQHGRTVVSFIQADGPNPDPPPYPIGDAGWRGCQEHPSPIFI